MQFIWYFYAPWINCSQIYSVKMLCSQIRFLLTWNELQPYFQWKFTNECAFFSFTPIKRWLQIIYRDILKSIFQMERHEKFGRNLGTYWSCLMRNYLSQKNKSHRWSKCCEQTSPILINKYQVLGSNAINLEMAADFLFLDCLTNGFLLWRDWIMICIFHKKEPIS